MSKDRNSDTLGSSLTHYFADVFNQDWQNFSKAEAEGLMDNYCVLPCDSSTWNSWIMEKPDVLGYFTDNEWSYGDLHEFIWGETGKFAFVDWLQGNNTLPSVPTTADWDGDGSDDMHVPAGFEHALPYATIGDLNSAWSSAYHTYNYASFADIYGADKPYIRGHDDPVKDDLFAFERVIFKIYVDTLVDNIRRVEDLYIQETGTGYHHPIFSVRISVSSVPSMLGLKRNMDIFSKFDVIALNWYPNDNMTMNYHPEEYMRAVEDIFYDTSGRPIFIAEYGMSAEDASVGPNLYPQVQRWRHKNVDHQYQRGWGYQNLVKTWANLPYIVGATWYKWANGEGLPTTDPRNSGLVDDFDNYYTNLTDNMRHVNKELKSFSRTGSFSIDDINFQSLNICTPGLDSDRDGVFDVNDICPNDSNPGQENMDGDALGNVCDADVDGDGLLNDDDTDDDNDGLPDTGEAGMGAVSFDPDTDNDGIVDGLDRDPDSDSNNLLCLGQAPDAFLNSSISTSITCADPSSVTGLSPPTAVTSSGDLLIISPRVIFDTDFFVAPGGRLSVISTDPTAQIPPP